MRVGEVALERRVADHLRKLRTCLRVAEERLREEDHERLAIITVDLATKDVELQDTDELESTSPRYEEIDVRS